MPNNRPEGIDSGGSIFDFYPGAKGQLLAILVTQGVDSGRVDLSRLEDSLALASNAELEIELTPGSDNPGILDLTVDIYVGLDEAR